MPRTFVEPRCNLTLSRADWSVMVALLERNGSPTAMKVRDVVRAALRNEPDAACVSIDNECQKWIGVEQLLFKQMCKSREGGRLYDEMRIQIQAAETADF